MAAWAETVPYSPPRVVPDRMHQRFDAGRMGRTQLRHVMLEEVAYLVVRYDRRTQKQHDPQQTARSEPPPHGIQQHGIQRNPSEPGRHEIEESVPESASVAVQGEQELPVEIEKRLPHSGVFRSVSKIRRKKRIANYPSAYGEGPVLRAVRAAGLTEEQSGSHGTPVCRPERNRNKARQDRDLVLTISQMLLSAPTRRESVGLSASYRVLSRNDTNTSRLGHRDQIQTDASDEKHRTAEDSPDAIPVRTGNR